MRVPSRARSYKRALFNRANRAGAAFRHTFARGARRLPEGYHQRVEQVERLATRRDLALLFNVAISGFDAVPAEPESLVSSPEALAANQRSAGKMFTKLNLHEKGRGHVQLRPVTPKVEIAYRPLPQNRGAARAYPVPGATHERRAATAHLRTPFGQAGGKYAMGTGGSQITNTVLKSVEKLGRTDRPGHIRRSGESKTKRHAPEARLSQKRASASSSRDISVGGEKPLLWNDFDTLHRRVRYGWPTSPDQTSRVTSTGAVTPALGGITASGEVRPGVMRGVGRDVEIPLPLSQRTAMLPSAMVQPFQGSTSGHDAPLRRSATTISHSAAAHVIRADGEQLQTVAMDMQETTDIQFSGTVTLDGHRLGSVVARQLSHSAATPNSTRSSVSLRSVPMFSGMQLSP
jgi:hypothetical protein